MAAAAAAAEAAAAAAPPPAPAPPAPPVDHLLNNLGILDSFWFIPPHVESATHSSTSVSPVHHPNVPLRFIYDPHALDDLSARLREMLDAGPLPHSVETKIREQLVDEQLYYRDRLRPDGVRVRRPTRVQYEVGLQENMVQRLLSKIVDRDRQRMWKSQGAPYDLGLFQGREHNDDEQVMGMGMGMGMGAVVDARGDDTETEVRIVTDDHGTEPALIHLEVKSGYNDHPDHPTNRENDPNETYGQTVVLGPRFFKELIKYLAEHGSVTYSTETESLSNYPAAVMREGSRVWYPFEDGRNQENISRVLCQMRTEFCKTLLIYPNDRYNKYIILSTFRDSVLFTLRQNAITISPIVSSRGKVTRQRPIGNLAALVYVLSHLDEEEYGVNTVVQQDLRRRGLRGGGPAKGGGDGDGDGPGPGPDDPSGGVDGGRRGQGGGGGREGQDIGPLQGQGQGTDEEDESLYISDDSDSSFSTSSTAITNIASTAPTSPLFVLFPGNGNENDKTRTPLDPLTIDFDQLHDCVAGDTLPNSYSPGSRIFQLGTYLSHHCLSRIDFLPLDTERLGGGTGTGTDHGDDAGITDAGAGMMVQQQVVTASSVHQLEVDGYLGIGALWTTFSAKSHLDTTNTSTTTLAVKFSAPDLYPHSPHRRRDGWTRAKVVQSVQREISAYNVLRQFGQEQGAGGIAPRCYGVWSGTSKSLGRVACMVLEKGESIADVSDLDLSERKQIVDLFVKLHSFGIIHRDVSLSNICRIPGALEASAPVFSSSSGPIPSPSPAPVPETASGSGAAAQPPTSPASQASTSVSMSKGRMVIIDFGAAAFSPAASASGMADVGRRSTEGLWQSVPDTPMLNDIQKDHQHVWTEDEWEEMKRDEMRRVVELVKFHPSPSLSSSSSALLRT